MEIQGRDAFGRHNVTFKGVFIFITGSVLEFSLVSLFGLISLEGPINLISPINIPGSKTYTVETTACLPLGEDANPMEHCYTFAEH